ncbi:MAG: restriction endonuclease subunit S, partial [Candidatus Contendobacter sp.]|nr:restriction endonuclease subunit S [Candidatus Contendobacter sp.]
MAIQWFSQPPPGWISKRLKFVAPLRISRAAGSSEEPEYIGLENIESWTGRHVKIASADPIGDDEIKTLGTSSCFSEGDILFGKLRPYLAKALLAKQDGICSTEFLVLQPHANIDARFLLYILLCPEFIKLINSSTFGAKMPRANWDFIGAVHVPLPQIAVQRRIADYLDAETAQIDALVAEKERMLALLEEKRAALISRAVTRGLDPDVPLKPSGLEWLGDIPAHWEIRRLGFLFILQGGCTPSKANDEFWKGEIAWASSKDIKQQILTDTEDHVSDEAMDKTGLSLIEPPVVKWDPMSRQLLVEFKVVP